MTPKSIRDPQLDVLLEKAVAEAVSAFAEEEIKGSEIGISILIRRSGSADWSCGGFRDDAPFYPASVVKMFYLAYAAHLIGEGRIVKTPELERAAQDMIEMSNNDATGYVLDLVCGTTPGPELNEEDLREFGVHRQAVNRWFESLGYVGVNAVQRTYNEGPYGRERQWVGAEFSNRNSLKPVHCTRLLYEIALGLHWGQVKTQWMRDLLNRVNPQDDFVKSGAQARGYIGRVIPAGTKLFSKAGWTSSTRHDAAWIVLPNGDELILAIFTNYGKNLQLVSLLAAEVLIGLGYEVERPVGDPVMPPPVD